MRKSRAKKNICTKLVCIVETRLSGLYAITPAGLSDLQTLAQRVESALRGGASLIQYRDKSGEHGQRRQVAERLLALTRQYGAHLIINDDVELAAAIGADGVHLGQEDTQLDKARKTLGPDALIGISCYNRFELAQHAAARGADYVAFGRFFPSRTKPDAVQASLELLQRARQELALPVAAIGGITRDNATGLIAAGADMLAMVEGVFGQPDIEATAREIQALFESTN